MRFMNDYDIQSARQRYGRGPTPNRLALAIMVDRLAEWANVHSDGWAYWPKPCRAAATAMGHIESTAYPEYDRRQREDITDVELAAAVKPVKAFLTRYRDIVSNDERDLILRSTT